MKNKISKRNKIIFSIFAIVIVFAATIYPSVSSGINYNNQIALAKEKLELELFDEARDHLYNARDYKDLSEADNDLLLDIIEIKTSSQTYSDAEKLFGEGKYIDASQKYKQVVEEDTKRYDLAMQKVEESIQKYLATGVLEQFEKENDYTAAKKEVENLLQLTTNKSQFDEKIKVYEEKIKEQKEIERKQKEEAARVEKEKKETERIQKVKNTIQIKEYYPRDPNSAGGVDFVFKFENKSDKDIKYVDFEVVPYNAVGDKMSCTIKRKSDSRGRVTGPISPGQSWGYDGRVFENAWYNYEITSTKLTEVLVTYMDGTSQTIKQDDLKHIIY